jgi:hypothetical protein
MQSYDGGSQGILAPRAPPGRNALAGFMDKSQPNSSKLEDTTERPF